MWHQFREAAPPFWGPSKPCHHPRSKELRWGTPEVCEGWALPGVLRLPSSTSHSPLCPLGAQQELSVVRRGLSEEVLGPSAQVRAEMPVGWEASRRDEWA